MDLGTANLPGPGELELEKHGLELIEPDLVYAHAFPDGRVLAVSRSLEKTVENIGRYSKKDAETWRALVERYRAAKDEIVASLFSAPPAFSAEAAAMERSPAGMDEYRFGLQSMRSWWIRRSSQGRSSACSAPSPCSWHTPPTTQAAPSSPGCSAPCCRTRGTTW